jgi:hypothetical protein
MAVMVYLPELRLQCERGSALEVSMNKPIEPDIPDTDIESTERVPEYAPLPNEIHEPRIPPQPEVDRAPIRNPSDERQYIQLESTADEDEGEPGQP